MKRRRPRPSALLVRRLATVCALTAGAGALPPPVGPNATLFAQREIRPPKELRQPFYGPPPPPSPAERIGKDLVRIGTITVDTAKKEFSVGGFINDVQVLEFLANTKGGWKAYESAIELDTNAVNFNVSCLLIGLDNTDAVPSKMQFDPAPPQGHPLELFVEWDEGGKPRRVRAEQLI